MTRTELITELKACEMRIYQLNTLYQYSGGEPPHKADPAVCARRNELREMLRKQRYAGGANYPDD